MVAMSPHRFVILHHKLPDGEHWDLMLEAGSTLATWQLPDPPTMSMTEPLSATRIGDHRTSYLHYEGPVSGNRGEVARYDHGTVQFVAKRADEWLIELNGTILAGRFRLARLPTDRPDRWQFSAL